MPKLTIYPYLYEETCWVFDDQRTGLKEGNCLPAGGKKYEC